MTELILASGSPRRKVLMESMGLEFAVVPSDFEEHLDDTRSPTEVAIELGFGKAEAVARKFPDALVIGGDLIVVLDNIQLAKPESPEEAKHMLRSLSNRTHEAVGSVVLVGINAGIRTAMADTVTIDFDEIPEEVMDKYIATGDPYDKAGGYARQHPLLRPFIHAHGDLHTLTGLSTVQLRTMLQEVGVSVPYDEQQTIARFNNSSLESQRILS